MSVILDSVVKAALTIPQEFVHVLLYTSHRTRPRLSFWKNLYTFNWLTSGTCTDSFRMTSGGVYSGDVYSGGVYSGTCTVRRIQIPVELPKKP